MLVVTHLLEVLVSQLDQRQSGDAPFNVNL